MSASRARRAAVAGQFYPRQPDELREAVEGYIAGSGVETAAERVVAVVAPHAGYIYSGPTAGYAYARVKGKKPERVIVMGCSHRYHFDGASVYQSGAFDTPLGSLAIDEEFARVLAKDARMKSDEPHLLEHALEVQLPFLRVALGEVAIVPVLFGGEPEAWHVEFGEKLAGMAAENDLVVASTDLSHYLSEEAANEIDKCTLDAVIGQDMRAFSENIVRGDCSMCGAAAVVAAMAFALASRAKAWSVLDYRTSGRTSGDYDRVVGYGAISMERNG